MEFEFQRMKVFSGLQTIDYSSIQNCVWECQLVSVIKIPTSLLGKENDLSTPSLPHNFKI